MMGLFIVTDLLKKLTILKDIPISIFTDVDYRGLYLSKKITLIDGKVGRYNDKLTEEYLSEKREVYTGRPDKTYVNNWQTYQNLIEVELICSESDFILTIQVNNGDSCYGIYTGPRWKGNFRLSVTAISLFENDINNEFDSEIDHQFVRDEKIRIQLEKDKIRAKLLA